MARPQHSRDIIFIPVTKPCQFVSKILKLAEENDVQSSVKTNLNAQFLVTKTMQILLLRFSWGDVNRSRCFALCGWKNINP